MLAIPQLKTRPSYKGDTTMLTFERLRDMLVGFANEPVETDYSDPRYVPIKERKCDDGFVIRMHGYPHNYESWIHPENYHSIIGYMGLRIQKSNDKLCCLTFRVAVYNAGKTYELKFNFDEDKPELEMRVGRGYNVTGERVHFEQVQCFDLVVLDLIEFMLPPQFLAHRPDVNIGSWGFQDKPCITCGTSIRNNHIVCANCHPDREAVAV